MGHSEQGHSLSRLRTGSCVKPGLGKVTSWKSQRTTFPRSLEIPQTPRDSHFSNPATAAMVSPLRVCKTDLMSERNGLNRRGSSLCGNENPSKFDPLCRPATRGLHHGQELSSTNRSDTFAQTNPPTPKILLAIGRRTIHFPRAVREGCASEVSDRCPRSPGSPASLFAA